MAGLPIGLLGFSAILIFAFITALLIRSEARLRATRHATLALDKMDDAFFVVDKNGQFRFANKRAAEIFGMPPHGLKGKDLQKVAGTDSFFCSEISRALKDGRPVSFEYFHPALNRWFEHHASPDADSVSVFAWDITSRRSIADGLKESEDRRRDLRDSNITNYISDASKILSSSLDCDATLQELSEFLVSNFADHCIVYVYEDKMLRRIAAADSPYGSSDESYDPETLLPEIEDVARKCQVRVINDFRSSGYCSALVPLPVRSGSAGVIHLATARESAFSADTLVVFEELGRRAAVALENSRLYERANEASRLKDEFVAIVSHELRTPLTPILGAVYMLRTETFNERIFNRALDLIERNAKAQAKIVEDLLDVSRILSGKLRLNWELVDMDAVIAAAIDTVTPAGEAKGIEIATDLRPLQSMVRGDTGRLQQVVWNLLANAVKFTPKGGRILIELKESQGEAELVVSDTGIGIGEEFLPFVFDRFRQEDSSRTRLHGGLGLGLAIVRHLVESHGGTVQVQSLGDEKGSTFTVRLPLKVVETAYTAQAGD